MKNLYKLLQSEIAHVAALFVTALAAELVAVGPGHLTAEVVVASVVAAGRAVLGQLQVKAA